MRVPILKHRPKAYWMSEALNWGDVFTPFLFKVAFGIDVDWAERTEAEVFSCGSLLERIPDGFAGHVLGSGMGYEKTRRDLRNIKSPLLLRGPLTAERCTYEQPVRFGDPGLLAYLFAKPIPKAYPYGVVPHYVDKDNPELVDWINSNGALKIDIEGGIQDVINAIQSCEQIVSSSLHGLVIADSLGIPSKWVKLSHRVLGEGFKFRDYYSAYDEPGDPACTVADAAQACRLRDVTNVRAAVLEAFQEYVKRMER